MITNMKTSPPYLQHRFLSRVAKDGGSDSRPEITQASNSIEAVNNPDSDTERPADYKPSKRHDLAMLFTCKVCETRSAKTMSRATYETGIVLVRCPKCKNLHLIADRLGWFGEPGSVEDFLEQQGVAVRKGVEETYEFSVEDLKGWTPPASNDPQSSGWEVGKTKLQIMKIFISSFRIRVEMQKL